MESLFIFAQSFVLIVVAEFGDKSQILAFALATRFKNTKAVMLGITAAVFFTHTAAAVLGKWLFAAFDSLWAQWNVAGLFLLFGLLMLWPDNAAVDEKDTLHTSNFLDQWGAFTTAAITFVLAELGDKTQLVTMAQAARTGNLGAVIMGGSIAMIAMAYFAILLGSKSKELIPLKWLKMIGAIIFIATAATIAWSILRY